MFRHFQTGLPDTDPSQVGSLIKKLIEAQLGTDEILNQLFKHSVERVDGKSVTPQQGEYIFTIIIDISSSMQNAIDFLKKILKNVMLLFQLAGVNNIFVVFVSDYDKGMPSTYKTPKVLFSHYGSIDYILAQMLNIQAGMIGTGGSSCEALVTGVFYAQELYPSNNKNMILITDAYSHIKCDLRQYCSDAIFEASFLQNFGINMMTAKKLKCGNRLITMSCNRIIIPESDVCVIDSYTFTSDITFFASICNSINYFVGDKLVTFDKSYVKDTDERIITLDTSDAVVDVTLIKNDKKYNERCTSCYNLIMSYIKSSPEILPVLPKFFSPIFLSLIKHLGKTAEWESFRQKMVNNCNKHVNNLVKEFISYKTNNISNVQKGINKFLKERDEFEILDSTPCLCYVGDTLNHYDIYEKLLSYVKPEAFRMFKECLNKFVVIPAERVKELNLFGFPLIDGFDLSKHTPLIFSAMTNFKSLPDAFKCASYCLANIDLEQSNNHIYKIVCAYLKEKYPSYLKWLVDNEYNFDNTQVSWWSNITSVNILYKLVEKIFPEEERPLILAKVELLKKLIIIKSTLKNPNQFSLNFEQTIIQKYVVFRVRTCTSGVRVPDQLCLHKDMDVCDCVLCVYGFTKGEFDAFGRKYEGESGTFHKDVREGLDKLEVFFGNDGFTYCREKVGENKHARECHKCGVCYILMDSDIATNPICFNCRSTSESSTNGCRSHKTTCNECNKEFLYARQVERTSTCDSCSQQEINNIIIKKSASKNVNLTDVLCKNITIKYLSLIFGISTNVLDMFFESDKNMDKATDNFMKLTSPSIQNIIHESDITRDEFVSKYFTTEKLNKQVLDELIFTLKEYLLLGDDYVVSNVTNLYQQMENIATNSRFDTCGICFETLIKTKLYDYCDNTCCNVLLCEVCIKLLNNFGNIEHPFSKLACPYCRVGRPNKTVLCNTRGIKLGPYLKEELLKKSGDNTDDYVFALCNKCNKTNVLPKFVSPCGVDVEPRKYTCAKCENSNTELIEDEASIEEFLEILPPGTVVRSCPTCKIGIMHSGGCAHMYCNNCNSDWCWICGCSFTNIGECYDHMEQDHNDEDWLNITESYPLIGEGVYIAGKRESDEESDSESVYNYRQASYDNDDDDYEYVPGCGSDSDYEEDNLYSW